LSKRQFWSWAAGEAEGEGLGVAVAVAPGASVGVALAWPAPDGVVETVGVALEAAVADGVCDVSGVEGVGSGESPKVAVGRGVSVAPASMMRGVAVAVGEGKRPEKTVAVAAASDSEAVRAVGDAVLIGVALGKTVMRGSGVAWGADVSVTLGAGVALLGGVGEGDFCGGFFGEQAAKAIVMSTIQSSRFIAHSPRYSTRAGL